MGRIIQYFKFLKKVNVKEFLFLNYFCRNVIRTDSSKIIPYKNSAIELADKAKVYLANGDIEIGCDLIRGSKAETRLRMTGSSTWSSNGGCKISYGSTVEIHGRAIFDTGYFTLNCSSVIVSDKRINIGNDVMISRNVVIYDSDFHSIQNQQGQCRNSPRQVTIGDHVWIGADSMILKGSHIGSGSIIAAFTKVSGDVGPYMVYQAEGTTAANELKGSWSRRKPE